ncbi:hypothetical protein ALC57_06175 [Trachymyrmex cornetzi]|uniref:Uncharacterized protein n=1 Tax=Trachymyrmex cornetzi TaxID=471704 RepID=A0A151J927_9HYME|nr:hypothetical protein ALC57_06175 [Trachymyrmex cornetzi]
MLLHKVPWKTGTTFATVTSSYITYLKSNYGDNVTIVFDGYDDLTTKSSERDRRSKKFISVEYRFNENTKVAVEKGKFLSNNNNKKNFIKLLHDCRVRENFKSITCKGDADRTIATEAIVNDYFPDKKVVVVSEDIDVLVILTALAEDQEIYFLKPKSSSGTVRKKIFSTKSLDSRYANVKKRILFAHAFTGCDTTSAFFNRGKKSFFDIINRDTPVSKKLCKAVDLFRMHVESVDELLDGGVDCLLELYGYKLKISGDNLTPKQKLSKARYDMFLKKNTLHMKSTKKNTVNIATLPLAINGFREHLKRVYYQVQSWIGFLTQSNEVPTLNPTDWGWKLNSMVRAMCLHRANFLHKRRKLTCVSIDIYVGLSRSIACKSSALAREIDGQKQTARQFQNRNE